MGTPEGESSLGGYIDPPSAGFCMFRPIIEMFLYISRPFDGFSRAEEIGIIHGGSCGNFVMGKCEKVSHCAECIARVLHMPLRAPLCIIPGYIFILN